jgi:hypothetical protein
VRVRPECYLPPGYSSSPMNLAQYVPLHTRESDLFVGDKASNVSLDSLIQNVVAIREDIEFSTSCKLRTGTEVGSTPPEIHDGSRPSHSIR